MFVSEVTMRQLAVLLKSKSQAEDAGLAVIPGYLCSPIPFVPSSILKTKPSTIMNTRHTLMRDLYLLRAVMLATLFLVARGYTQSIGQWDFNSGNLAATAGSTQGDLAYADTDTQTGTAFGTTTSLGIPDINGTPANVMRFPAATNTMGYNMLSPGPNGGGSFVNEYTIIFDLLYPSNGVARPLVDIDDTTTFVVGPEFIVNTAGGVGVPPTGPFDGLLTPNTWNRVGFTVNATEIRKYVNGLQVGSQPHSFEGRLALPANNFVRLLGNAVGDAGLGYVNSIQLRDATLSSAQMAAIGGPSAAGIPVTIPAIPSYVQSWTPPGSVARTTTDLGAVIFPGEASVATNTIVMKLNNVVQTGVQVSSNGVTGLITVFKPNSGALTAGTTYTLEINYTDSQVGAKVFSKVFKAALLFEDFEQLTLGSSIEEGGAGVHTNVWTKTPPPGWSIDDSGMPNVVSGDLSGDGVAEWNGWSFASKTFWGVITDNQNRQFFTLGQGTVAVADPDEWDDAAHPQFDTNGNALYFNSYLTTPTINIAGVPANSIYMKFDSSWRPEGFDDWGGTNNQTALITASYNGGAPVEVLRWDSVAGPFFHDDNENEKVSVLMNNPVGATNLVVKIGMLKGANDWWWAFDNLEINIGDIPSSIFTYTPAAGAVNVGPRPQIGAVITPGTTTISPGSVQILLDGTSLPVTVSTDAASRTVASARAPAVLPKLSTHTNTLIYSDSLNGFQTNTWTFTVANYDEITLGTPVWMEEFNGVYEGTWPAGWVATNRTSAIRTNYDLGDVGSAAYENFVVVSTNRANVFNARRHNVRPATLNGVAVDTLMDGNVAYGESDRRGGEQVQVLFSPVINLTGISNVRLGFNSIYEQNQDSMGGVEYSIDGGATWLPLLYMVKSLENDDIITGDPVATLGTARADQAWDLAYNAFIGATVDASFGPYISGRVDDDPVESKRIEVLSMPQAANQSNVRLRFTHTGTGSWYFGVDNVGIYGDGGVNKAVVFASQPQGGTIPANTSALLVAGVDPTSTRPLSFQWTRNGTNITGATSQSYSITSMQASDAGDYRLIVSNVSGSVTSQVATLNYVLPQPPVITQNPTNRAVETDLIGTFTVTATGTAPLGYQWYFATATSTNALAGATSATLSLQHVDPTNAGSYFVAVTNNYGSITSLVATLTVLPASPVEITGQWDFDCGTLQATVGNDLKPFNATVAADTQFGTTTSFAIGDIGGSPARVLYFNNSTANWGGYQMYHGAVPNGGGAYVNRYTVIYDVYYPTASNNRWRSFLQTNTGNSNDGDIFANTANGLGISGNYQGNVTPDAWHRIVFVFDQTYATLKKYIDGTLVGTQTVGGLDSRWTLDPYALLFGDEDGDQAPTYVNSVQFRNGVMTDAEVAALGGATSAFGIPGAVPRICSVTVSGNTVTITWPGQPDVKLRKTTSLTNPNWTDVAGSLGASSANDPFSAGGAYYRLQRQ
jgi:hypothetical protein